jgi:predicted phage tail protein/sulfur carrier protein ThiS
MVLFKYIPNRYADKSYEVEVEPCKLIDGIEELINKHPAKKQSLHCIKCAIYINGEWLEGADWQQHECQDGDVIEITHTIEGGVLTFIFTFGGLLDFSVDPPEAETESTEEIVWDGPKTNTKQGVVMPVVYGTHGVGGTYINFNIWSDGEDNYADMLVALCEGEISGIRNEADDGNAAIPSTLEDVDTATPHIRLNEQFISDYDEASWAGRSGTNLQTSIQGFRNLQTLYDYAYDVPAERDSPGGKWTLLYTTNADIDQFDLKMQADQLYNYNKKGKMRSNGLRYRVRHSVTGQDTWTYDPPVSGTVDNSDSWHKVSGKSQSATKVNLTVDVGARDRYDVQIQRYTPATNADDAKNPFKVMQLTEIVSEDLAYPNTAVLAIRVKATDQISGSFPEILTTVQGSKVRVPDLDGGGGVEFEEYYWTGTGNNFAELDGGGTETWDGASYIDQYTSNPAYCMRDFLINTRFGVGDAITDADLDNTAIDNAAKRCWQKDTESGIHKSELHIVLDGKSSPSDHLSQMALVSRIYVFWSGGFIKLKYLEDEDPVQLITMGNILEGKFSTTYISQTSIPNILAVTFADKADNFKSATRELVDEAEWALNKPQRKKTLSLKGVTTTSQALREAKYHLNRARWRRRVVSLTTTVESLHCEPGDIVAVQHDVPQWGWGGRALTNSTSTTINLDQEVPANVVGDPTAYDIKVIHAEDDSIETFDILSVSGKEVTIDGNWDTTPAEDDSYIIGVTDASIKEYRVTDMTVNEDDSIRMKLEEHLAAIYSDTGYVVSDDEASELPNPAAFPPPITNLTLYELHNEVGMGVSFSQPKPTSLPVGVPTNVTGGSGEIIDWDHADIFMSTDNEKFVKVAEGYGSDDVELTGLMPGIQYYIDVYSINKIGIANVTPVSATITLTGANIGPPASATGLEIDDGGVGQGLVTTFGGKDCKFKWNLNAPYGGAGSLEPQQPAGIASTDWAVVRDFKIEIWNYTGTIKIRTEYTTDKFYAYTYAKNYEDSGGIPRREFQIKVYQRNWFSLESIVPAILAVDNPRPNMAVYTPQLDSIYRGVRVDFSSYRELDNDMDYYKVMYGYNNPPTASVDYVGWRNQVHSLQGLAQLTKVYVQIVPYDAFGVGATSAVASGRTDGFDFVNASLNEWTIKADAIIASIIKHGDINSSHIGVEHLSAIEADIGTIRTGYINGVIITGGMFRTAESGKRIEITGDGIALALNSGGEGYGYVRYGDDPAENASIHFGTGAIAYIHHMAEAVPFYIAAEQTVGDFHFYNRSSDPSGLAEVGDVCVVNSNFKICISGGVPGTWELVGNQASV